MSAKLNESRVTLLHIVGLKSRKESKNYLPITVIYTSGKVFSGILSNRLSDCCDRNRVMGEEQNKFHKDSWGKASCL